MNTGENLKEALRESMRLNGDKRRKEPMSAQQIFNVLIATLLALAGWIGNNVWSLLQSQQQQITQLNVELAKNYVPRAELQENLKRIFDKLDAIDQQTRTLSSRR